jgi:hypothetical protein
VLRENNILGRVQTLENFAITAQKDGKFDEAVTDMKEAIEICGNCRFIAQLHKNLGLIECQAGHR